MIENFTFLGKTMSAYMILALAGIFASGIFTIRLAKKRGLDDLEYLITLLWSGVGILVGGTLLYGITNLSYLQKMIANWSYMFEENLFWGSLLTLFGGSVFYGGLLGGLLAAALSCKLRKQSLADFADLGALAIPLFHVFGRVGCFLSGCCYGMQWQGGFIYEHALAPGANGVPRFPVQLVEALFNLLLFFSLYLLYKNRKFEKSLMYLYLLTYSVGRFILEFFRGDLYRGFLFGLSTSQIISILIFAAGLILLLQKNRRPANRAPEKSN